MSSVVEQRFTPWPFARAELDLRVTLREVEGAAWTGPPGEGRELELPPIWQQVRLGMVASCSAALLDQLLEPDERSAPPVSWLFTLRCDATRVRRTLIAQPWAARVEHTLELYRDELAGPIELSAMLVRSDTRDGATERASERGAKLASAPSWTIYADGRPADSGHSLDVQWCSFAEDPRVPRNARTVLYRVLLELDPPLLLLNLDHAELRTVLDGKGTRGARARLRDLVFERIEAPVWTALLVHAAACLSADDELPFAWQRRVLDHWLPLLYPDLDAPEARARLVHDYAHLPELLVELDTLMQMQGKLPELAHALLTDTEGE